MVALCNRADHYIFILFLLLLLPVPQKRAEPHHNFRPMHIVARRLDESRCHLGMEVGLGPCHIVLDREPAPPLPKGGGAPNFLAHIQMAGAWMDQDATW